MEYNHNFIVKAQLQSNPHWYRSHLNSDAFECKPTENAHSHGEKTAFGLCELPGHAGRTAVCVQPGVLGTPRAAGAIPSAALGYSASALRYRLSRRSLTKSSSSAAAAAANAEQRETPASVPAASFVHPSSTWSLSGYVPVVAKTRLCFIVVIIASPELTDARQQLPQTLPIYPSILLSTRINAPQRLHRRNGKSHAVRELSQFTLK